jgi:hypothetical protein
VAILPAWWHLAICFTTASRLNLIELPSRKRNQW